MRFQLALTLAAVVEKADAPALSGALVRLAKQDHAHPWISQALLVAPPQIVAHTLFATMAEDSAAAAPFIAQLIEIRAASQPAEDRTALIRFLTQGEPNPLWLRALGDGLRRAGTTIEKADTEKSGSPPSSPRPRAKPRIPARRLRRASRQSNC